MVREPLRQIGTFATGVNTYKLPIGRSRTIERVSFGLGSTTHSNVYVRLYVDQLHNSGRGLAMMIAYGYVRAFSVMSKDIVWEGKIDLPDETEWALYATVVNRTGITNLYNMVVHFAGDDAK